MGGICGWVTAARAGPTGQDDARASALRGVMTGAIAHRGGVRWLDRATLAGAAAPGPIAADSVANSQAALERAFSESSGDPAALATRLKGPFAVAALDPARGRLILARDRLGEKPLYWTSTQDGIAFASEIKALIAAGLPSDRALRPEALDAYLAFTYIPAPWTILRQVHKVPSGHCVSIDVGIELGRPSSGGQASWNLVRYWKLPASDGTQAEPAEAIARLSEALARRIPDDRRAVIFLSGGLDSSVVAALYARATGRAPTTLSIGFPAQGRLDESQHARRVARLLGSDHHEISCDEMDAETARSVIAQLDEPMADAACLPTFVLAREASRTAPVALTGDGADALLAGDHWFRRLKRLDALARMPSIVRALIPGMAFFAELKNRGRSREMVRLAALPPGQRYLSIRQKWTPSERLAIYNPAFARSVDMSRTAATYLDAPVGWGARGSVEAAIRLDAAHGLPEDLLMKADKMCGAHGVDSRSPFMDQDFVEWAARLDVNLHLRGSSSKDLLKRAAESLLPRDLVWRRKHGFQTPIGRWMKGPLRGLTEAAFDPSLVQRQAIFDADTMARLKASFEAAPEGPGSAALNGRVWQIVALQTWWRQIFGSR